MPKHLSSVVFHKPCELAASVRVCGYWKRPLVEVLIESGAAVGGLGIMVGEVCSGFIEWCLRQNECPFDAFDLTSLPGLPFPGVEFDRGNWYDTLLAEFAGSDDPPILVDLHNYEITHRGEVLWPPPDQRKPRKVKPRVEPGEVFAVGWFGVHLGCDKRRNQGTYTCFLPEEVPPTRIELMGTFDWLQVASAKRSMASAGKMERCLERLIASGIAGLPDEFIRFFQQKDLWSKIRSCTDCYFNLDTTAVEIPGNLGKLVRFLSDSQDCLHWSLLITPCGTKHSVVATSLFSGSECARTEDRKPYPRDITRVASSFEEFIYRFWLENELFYAAFEKSQLLSGGAEYLAFY